MKHRIVVIGAGGHARVVISLLQYGPWEAIGVLDRSCSTIGELISGVPIIGCVEDLPTLKASGVVHAVLALGDNRERREIYLRCRDAEVTVPTLIHPRAFVETSALVGAGTVVCAGAMVMAEAIVGANVILNTGAQVDHESRIGDHSHIGPGAKIAGRCRVGDGCFMGAGAVVKDRLEIGVGAVVGAGAVVLRPIPERSLAYGVPAAVKRAVAWP